MHSKYASFGTPHLLWNHSAAVSLSVGFSLNVIKIYGLLLYNMIELNKAGFYER